MKRPWSTSELVGQLGTSLGAANACHSLITALALVPFAVKRCSSQLLGNRAAARSNASGPGDVSSTATITCASTGCALASAVPGPPGCQATPAGGLMVQAASGAGSGIVPGPPCALADPPDPLFRIQFGIADESEMSASRSTPRRLLICPTARLTGSRVNGLRREARMEVRTVSGGCAPPAGVCPRACVASAVRASGWGSAGRGEPSACIGCNVTPARREARAIRSVIRRSSEDTGLGVTKVSSTSPGMYSGPSAARHDALRRHRRIRSTAAIATAIPITARGPSDRSCRPDVAIRPSFWRMYAAYNWPAWPISWNGAQKKGALRSMSPASPRINAHCASRNAWALLLPWASSR